MPLSEQEQRLLDEMERNLYHNDADFVSAVSGGRGRLNYGSLVLGILLALAGLAVIIVGVVIHQPLIGILGFAVMFAGVLLSLRRSKGFPRSASSAKPSTAKAGSTGRGNSSFMDRINDRWDNREERD